MSGIKSGGSWEAVGPAGLFDLEEILDESTLDTKIFSDETVPSVCRPGKMVRVIRLTFHSQTWHGFSWDHEVHIYVPEDYQGNGNSGIVATNCYFWDEDSEQTFIQETGLNTEAEYAEGTALDLGIPILIFSAPPNEINGMHESDLMGYGSKKMAETHDLTWYGYYAVTVSYLRAITLLHSLPGIETERAVLYGCSKRGLAVILAAAADPDRVPGVMSTCWAGGNHLYFTALKLAQLGADVRGPDEDLNGPGYHSATFQIDQLNSPVGFQQLLHYDPYLWRDKLKSSLFVALGTNDEFFALGAPNPMMEKFNGDKAFLAIDNLHHTWVSEKHLAGWRMWLAHIYDGRKIPVIQVESEIKDSLLHVSADVEHDTSIEEVGLYCAQNETTDWRFATWFSIPMNQKNHDYTAQIDVEEGRRLAYYVEVKDQGKGGTGYTSSLIDIIN